MLILCVLSFESICGRTLRVYLVGDSTCAAKELAGQNPERGWGQLFQPLFDGSVRVENHATNGRSTKSFRDEGRWAAVYDKLQPGDYVFIQFGHNDEKPDVDRATDAHVTYPEYLGMYIDAARRQGAEPILLTPIARRRFDENGKLQHTHGEYPAVMRDLADYRGVRLLDMERASEKLLTALGSEGSQVLFNWQEHHLNYPDGVQDNTHLSDTGAVRMAQMALTLLEEAQ